MIFGCFCCCFHGTVGEEGEVCCPLSTPTRYCYCLVWNIVSYRDWHFLPWSVPKKLLTLNFAVNISAGKCLQLRLRQCFYHTYWNVTLTFEMTFYKGQIIVKCRQAAVLGFGSHPCSLTDCRQPVYVAWGHQCYVMSRALGFSPFFLADAEK